MGLAHSPSIVRDGLVLHLDAANTKCYPPDNLEVEYLIVAGGGGGGGSTAGGGGAGGLLTGKISITNSSHSIVVGAGGAGSRKNNDGAPNNTNGSDSTCFGLTAVGGGKGYSGVNSGSSTLGATGGSGGGGGYYSGNVGSKGTGTNGAGTAGQGFAGGDGAAVGQWGGGGGGGARGVGASQNNANINRVGGPGASSFIEGSKKYYAGGGGGGCHSNGFSLGGVGGGGNGADGQSYTAESGDTNTGGGGGGGGYYQHGPGGGAGGSGIVVVRYKGSQKATGGDSVYQSGPYTVHVFNNSGNFVVGNTAGDISGNQNTGALTNGVSFNSANSGGFDFDGVDDFLDIGNCTDYFPSGSQSHSFAISLWVKPTSTGNNIFFGQQNVSNQRLYIGINSSSWDFGWGGLGWGASGSSGSFITATTNWTNIVLNISNGVATLYVNGAQSISRTDTAVNLQGKIPIGAYYYLNSYNSYSNPNIISNSMFYNRSLTQPEIAQNFEATRGRYGI